MPPNTETRERPKTQEELMNTGMSVIIQKRQQRSSKRLAIEFQSRHTAQHLEVDEARRIAEQQKDARETSTEVDYQLRVVKLIGELAERAVVTPPGVQDYPYEEAA